jgi:hypothetical protein
MPLAAGDFSPDMVLATGVVPVATVNYVTEGAQQKPPEPIYPDVEITSVKFVWTEGASQQVQCRNEPVVACSPSCYVRTFKAGPCEISAVIDGVNMGGTVVVLQPGKYDCNRNGGDLVCTGP